MDAEEARQFKHELRTPINQIVGYSALLYEAAQADCDSQIEDQACEIHAVANELAKAVEKALLNFTGTVSHAEICVMAESLRPLTTSILNRILPTTITPRVSSYLEDLERIRSASERLQVLLQSIGRYEFS